VGRLDGLGIVITRPLPAARAMARDLAAEGARTFLFPALAIEALEGSPALGEALDLLPRARMAIFVSANAVEHGLAAVRRHAAWPPALQVAAIGQATAEALRNSGFERVISPREGEDSEALLALAELQADRVSGENVVIFRGEGGRERLKDELQARGAQVVYAECYRRSRPPGDPAALLRALADGEVQAISAMSGETLQNFVAMVGEAGASGLAGTVLVVPHEAVGRHPAARAFERVVVCGPGIEGLTHALSRLRVIP